MSLSRRQIGVDKKSWETMALGMNSTTTGSVLLMPKIPIKANTPYNPAFYIRTTNDYYFYDVLNDAQAWAYVSWGTLTGGAGLDAAYYYETPLDYANYPYDSVLDSLNFLSSTKLKLQSDFFNIGLEFQICEGPNEGVKRKIIAIEPNSDSGYVNVTIDRPLPVAITTYTKYRVLRGGYVLLTPFTGGWPTNAFRYLRNYNYFSDNTFTTPTGPTGVTTWGTAGKVIVTPSIHSGSYFSNTATSASTNTISDSSQSWYTDEWRNYQVRILSGTGEGQRRTITANTANTITVSNNWTTQPDATSVYSLEACDDFIYLQGNNSAAIHRYQVTTQSWISTNFSYGRAYGTTTLGTWIPKSEQQAISTNAARNKKGNCIYQLFFEGNASPNVYIINLQVANYIVSFGVNSNQWTGGTIGCAIDYEPETGNAYAYLGPNSNNSVFKIEQLANGQLALFPYSRDLYAQSTGVVGEKMKIVVFEDEDGNKTKYIYMLHNSSTVLRRLLIT